MNFTTMGLIILGGLGFVVWKDLWQGFKKIVKDKVPVKSMIQQWRLQTKIVLSITSFLILFGTILIFLFEYHNPATMESLSLPQKIQASLFQSVTTRTAGFETVAQAALTDQVKSRKELVEKYHAQLEYYAHALSQLTGKTVKEKIIYSFTLKEEIIV